MSPNVASLKYGSGWRLRGLDWDIFLEFPHCVLVAVQVRALFGMLIGRMTACIVLYMYHERLYVISQYNSCLLTCRVWNLQPSPVTMATVMSKSTLLCLDWASSNGQLVSWLDL